MVSRIVRQYAKSVVETVPDYSWSGVPQDLNGLAKQLGAIDVLYQSRTLEGFIEFKPCGPVIYLAATKSDGRRRFTLAHECGHLMLTLPGTPEPPAVEGGIDEESLCDAIAAELLLPTEWLLLNASKITTLATMLATAKDTRVSMAMLTNRLAITNSSHVLFRLRQSMGSWFIVERAGTPKAYRGDVEIGTHTQNHLATLNEGHHRTNVHLQTRTGLVTLPAELYKQSRTVLMLFNRTSMTSVEPG
jgi:Zn-dependent peptidase ImmA (M78 family)